MDGVYGVKSVADDNNDNANRMRIKMSENVNVNGLSGKRLKIYSRICQRIT